MNTKLIDIVFIVLTYIFCFATVAASKRAFPGNSGE